MAARLRWMTRSIAVMPPNQENEMTKLIERNLIDAGKPTCRVVSAAAEFRGKQGHFLAPGISAQSVGAQGINLQIARIPPGERSKVHKHEHHETAIHVLSGESGMWFGERLEQHLVARAGDFLYIPANVPHLPYNMSNTESCVAVIARTDPNEQESVILLPELDKLDV
jgi:uncharacterized RmlC-like cupin family protein